MRKELSIRQLLIDSLGFMGSNFALLGCLTLLSFSGSYLAQAFNAARNPFTAFLYILFIYFFYYLFISLYFNQRPLLNKEKFADSLIKLLSILGLSLFILILGKIGLNILHYFSHSLIIFPEVYLFLRRLYLFMLLDPYAKIIIYLAIILLLTFSFFIPGFAWISTFSGKDASILSAYAKVSGNYIKTAAVFVTIYGILPLFLGFIGIHTSKEILAFLYAFQTVLQISVYLQLYETFYKA